MKKKRKIPLYAVVTIIAVICVLIPIINLILNLFYQYVPNFKVGRVTMEDGNARRMLSYINNNIVITENEENEIIVSLYFNEEYHTIIYDITSEYYLFDVKRLIEQYLENNPQVEFNDYKVKIFSNRDTYPNLPQEYWWMLESTNDEIKFDKLLCGRFNKNDFHNPDFNEIIYLNPMGVENIDYNLFSILKIVSLYPCDSYDNCAFEDIRSPINISQENLNTIKNKLPKDCQIIGYVINDDEGITQWKTNT